MDKHYKLGDRVRIINVDDTDSAAGVKAGMCGIVTHLGGSISEMKLELPISLHRGVRGEGGGFLFYPNQVEVVPVASGSDLAIDRYQSACAAFEQAQEALERAKQAVADARIDIGRALESEP